MSVEVHPLDLDDPPTLEALVALQRASYRIEAELLGAHSLPALTESPAALRACGESFLGAFDEDGRLVGAVSSKRDGTLLDVHRLVVHPDCFRRGIGGQLLEGLDAHEAGVERTLVATGAANHPARRLYEGRGFTALEERIVQGHIRIITYERRTA